MPIEKSLKQEKRIEDSESLQTTTDQITIEINELHKKAEELGEDGKVDEAKQALNRAEQLNQQKAAAQINQLSYISEGGPGNQQKLRVCDVCSAYLSLYDSDRRLADHFGGKLHIGFHLIREKLTEVQRSNPQRAKDSSERHRDRDHDRHRDKHARHK